MVRKLTPVETAGAVVLVGFLGWYVFKRIADTVDPEAKKSWWEKLAGKSEPEYVDSHLANDPTSLRDKDGILWTQQSRAIALKNDAVMVGVNVGKIDTSKISDFDRAFAYTRGNTLPGDTGFNIFDPWTISGSAQAAALAAQWSE